MYIPTWAYLSDIMDGDILIHTLCSCKPDVKKTKARYVHVQLNS